MLNNLLNNVFFRVDVQVLQSRGSAAVGYYANAYKVIDAAGQVPSSFVLALFPLLSRRAAVGPTGDQDAFARVYHLALKLLVAVALPLGLLVTAGAESLTRWLWGAEFLPDSAVALRILIWFLPLSFFNGLTQYVLIAAGLQRRITLAFALAAAFNVTANLLLVPRYSYVAAAAVTIASEVVLLVPFLLALRVRLPAGPAVGAALRPAPAALAVGLVLWLLTAWSLLGAAAVAAVLYPALLLLTGAFSPAERRTLLEVVRRTSRPQ
jgi:O-antigen/teichoic acid export membrane protein